MVTNCPKCGQDNLKVEHTPVGVFVFSEDIYNRLEDYSEKQTTEFGAELSNRVVTKEHIKCKCNTCKYTWATNTLDAR